LQLPVASETRTAAAAVITLALGADRRRVTKPYLYGLAAGGRERAALVTRMLRDEMEGTMRLLGVDGTRELRARWAEPMVLGGSAGSGMARW
jgi:L-lactate dehydrogenase (cytochrome)